MTQISPIKSIPGLWRTEADTCGYLLVRNGRSLLIDCPVQELSNELTANGLPFPEIVLHTQVQEEHTREWAAFPAATVYVADNCFDIATLNNEYRAASNTRWPLSREWDSRGEEIYGIAGCVTERPPLQPLNVAGLLVPGDSFTWEGIILEILALPGSGKRAIGIYWREVGALFSGDLISAGGYLVNFYDLERGYGLTSGYQQLHDSLGLVLNLNPILLLPSTGPVIEQPVADIAVLTERLSWMKNSPNRSGIAPATVVREFGRYKEIMPGIYQNNNMGNIILYVTPAGQGLIIDPDPCVWLDWDATVTEVHADFDLLERETGLKCIELAFITHYHGDHCEFSDLLRQRYGTQICATPDVAAVLEDPYSYPYPCTFEWYDLSFDHVAVDRKLPYEESFDWHGISIMPIHSPGHCYAHSGFLIPWNGILTACTGDTVQYSGGDIFSDLPISYNDTAWPDFGFAITFQRLLQAKPTLILGGHSNFFFDPDQAVLRKMLTVYEETESLVAQLVPDGDLRKYMTPPGFDALRPAQTV